MAHRSGTRPSVWPTTFGIALSAWPDPGFRVIGFDVAAGEIKKLNDGSGLGSGRARGAGEASPYRAAREGLEASPYRAGTSVPLHD
jgi:hypothetical protein